MTDNSRQHLYKHYCLRPNAMYNAHILRVALVALLHRHLRILAPTHALSLAATCNETDWQTTANTAFDYFEKQVRSSWSNESASRSAEVAQAATEGHFSLNLQGTKQQCLVEYVYHASRRSLQLGRRFKANHDCHNVKDRMYIVLLVLEKLVSKQPLLGALTHDFRFWVDITDSSVINTEALDLLSYPVLAFGRAPDATRTLPIPELYLQYAIVAKHRELFRQMRRLTALNTVQHRQLALRMLSLFTYKTMPSTSAWETKKPKAVYRGSCFPTVNPWGDREGASPVFFLRGDVCRAVQTSGVGHLLDFGLRVDNAFTDSCNPKDEFYASLCKGCSECTDAPPLDTQTMSQYKYLLQIDGYGPSFDSWYWKLSANSVVLQLAANDDPHVPFYVQWLSPVLQAGRHFLPFTLATLDEQVQWCVDHDDACRDIAAAAQRLMRCSVSLDTAEHYLKRALQLVHDTQQPGHVKGEGGSVAAWW